MALRKKQKDRPIERVLRCRRIQEYLRANGLRVRPPYSATQWNYWHINQGWGIEPITADELLQQYVEWKREHYVSAKEEAAAQHLYPLRPELGREIERLKQILAAHGKEFVPQKGVPKARLQRTEKKLGYRLDPDLCAFYAFSDGSPAYPAYKGWFAIGKQQPEAVDFRSLDQALKSWHLRVDNRNEAEDREYTEKIERLGNLTRDPRIAPGLWFPPQWWAFAGTEPEILTDACPGKPGCCGQIIVYYHDPDQLVWVADNFLDFFQKSNDLLESQWDKIHSE